MAKRARKAKKVETRSYLVPGYVRMTGYYIVDAESPEDARDRVNNGEGRFDESSASVNGDFGADGDGELNE